MILDTIAKGEAVPKAGYRQRQRLLRRQTLRERLVQVLDFGFWIKIQRS
jgi:hypothetical protein